MENLKALASVIGEKNIPIAAITMIFIFTGYLNDKREDRFSTEMKDFRSITMEVVQRANESIALNNELMRRVINAMDNVDCDILNNSSLIPEVENLSYLHLCLEVNG